MKEIMHFEDQHEGEKVIMVIRKHFVAYAKVALIFLIIFVFPVILLFLALPNFQGAISSDAFWITGAFSCIYLLYGLALLLVMWINEAFDIFILTNERLVDVTQVNFFQRTTTTTPLNQIQDTTSNVKGLFRTVLNYGDVGVKTAAGSASMFFIDSVPRPDKVAESILLEARKYHK